MAGAQHVRPSLQAEVAGPRATQAVGAGAARGAAAARAARHVDRGAQGARRQAATPTLTPTLTRTPTPTPTLPLARTQTRTRTLTITKALVAKLPQSAEEAAPALVEAYSRKTERKALVHKLAARSPSSPSSPKSPSSSAAGAKAGGSVTQRYRYFSSQRAFVRLMTTPRLLTHLPTLMHTRTPHTHRTPRTHPTSLCTPSPLHPSPVHPLQGAPADRPRRGAPPVSRGGAAAPAAARPQRDAAAPHDILPARPLIGQDAAGAAEPDPPTQTQTPRPRPRPPDPDPDPDLSPGLVPCA